MTPRRAWKRNTPGDLAAVATGGAVGTLLRLLGHTLRPQASGSFPWTTLGENLLGAFVLGWVAACLLAPAASLRARLFLVTGVLGSFTTFSALAVEGVELLALAPGAGLAYLGASLALGPPLAWAGLQMGQRTS